MKAPEGYGVFEFKNVKANLWVHVGAFFDVISDAYAALGMMSQRVVLHDVPEKYLMGETPRPPKLTRTVTEYKIGPDGKRHETEKEEEII